MKSVRQIVLWTAALGLIPAGAAAGPPSVPEGYTIEAYVTGLGNPTALAFSPGGQRIVSGSVDSTIKVWDATSDQK